MEYGNGIKNELIWKTTENKYHNENFAVNENNINVNVAMLSKYVMPGSNVLDIGCGEGKFGALIASKNCIVIGIDLDPISCEAALHSGHYEKVFNVNVEQPELTKQEYEAFQKENIKYDRIALIDVLEHVINPTALIDNSVQQLKDGGKILVSVPNVNNGDIFLNLLRDHFNYREAGVLDNTHTKYFTKSSFLEWIQEINETFEYSLNCEYVGSTFGYTDYMKKMKEQKPKVYQFIQQNPYFHVIQHLFVLTYHKNRNIADIVNVEKLLQASQIDLTELLEKQLSFSEEIVRTDLLPNERQILEEEVQSAETGWKTCANELEKASEKIAKQEIALKEASEFQNKLQEAEKVFKDRLEEQKQALEEARIYQERLEEQLKKDKAYEAGLERKLEESEFYRKRLEDEMEEHRGANKKLKEEFGILQKELEKIKETKIYRIMECINGKRKSQ